MFRRLFGLLCEYRTRVSVFVAGGAVIALVVVVATSMYDSSQRAMDKRIIKKGKMSGLVTVPGFSVSWKNPATAVVYENYLSIEPEVGGVLIIPRDKIYTVLLD